MDTILGICGACIEHEMDRKSMIVALGGGVVEIWQDLPRQYLCAVLILYKCLQHYFHSRTALSAEKQVLTYGKQEYFRCFSSAENCVHKCGNFEITSERTIRFGYGRGYQARNYKRQEFFDYIEKNSDKIKTLDNETL